MSVTKLNFTEFKNEVCNILQIESEGIDYDSNIYQDIGIDSLGLVNLGVKIQKLYSIEITPAILIEMQTIGEVYECVYKIIQANSENL